jgi:hypothetical protein
MELEDPKDLRAEIGKYPTSTNERKQMSIKTIKQRIAVVAVTALATGVLSVVTVPTATAADNVQAGTAAASVVASAQGTLNIASIVNTTGVSAVSSVDAGNLSVGLVNVSDIAGTLNAGTTQTAVMLGTGVLTVYTETAATGSSDDQNYAVITVDNGTIVGTSGASAVNSSNTVAALSGSESTTTRAVSIKPNTGATSMTVRMFNGTTTTYSSATAATISPASGTLAGQISVTIAAANVSGVMDVTKSGIYYDETGGGGQSSDDTAGTWATKSPAPQFANIRIKDAFGIDLASQSGLLQASATNGALVAINAASTTSTGTASTAFRTAAAIGDVTLVVSTAAFAPLTTTVTVTYNGVQVGTKSFTFTGPVAKVNLGAPLRIKELSGVATLGNGIKGGTISFEDAAGNVVYPTAGGTYYNSGSLLVSATSDRSPVMVTLPTSSVTGYYDWNCGTSASTDKAIFNFVNINGTVVTSNTVTPSCAGNAVSYAASFDKASYTPGEVAVLSVTFKDSKGNLANDTYDWSSGSFGSTSVSTGGGLLAVASAATDTSAKGVATYRVLTGVTEGTYNAVVNVDALTAQSAVTATYTIKASSATVTNAEVLKSIVSLIASINKQIQALQKLILRR